MKIYWGDGFSNRIERSELDGSDRVSVFEFSQPPFIYPFGLVVLKEAIVWTDWVSGGVEIMSRNQPNITSLLLFEGGPSTLHDISYHTTGDVISGEIYD